MKGSKCHGCRAPIVFVRMLAGNVMPVDPAPDDLGNVIARRTPGGALLEGRVLGDKRAATPPGLVRLMPHWATCSNPPRRKPAPETPATPAGGTTGPATADADPTLF